MMRNFMAASRAGDVGAFGTTVRVAVIDDDPGILDSLQLLFALEGIDTLLYNSAAAFLADRGRNRISCIILDHHMPKMTGLELAEILRRRGEDIPILLVTGAPAPAIVQKAKQLSIEAVLEKPPTEDLLLDFARRHLQAECGPS